MSKIIIDGVEYAPIINTPSRDGMDYCIVRTYSAGVFAGYLDPTSRSKDGKRGIVKQARRLWYWKGAASLSQLSQDGVKNTDECKFPVEIPEVELTEIIEVLKCTVEAQESI